MVLHQLIIYLRKKCLNFYPPKSQKSIKVDCHLREKGKPTTALDENILSDHLQNFRVSKFS